MSTRGVSVSFLIFSTREKNLSIFVPFSSDIVLAFWITGPSARGSENGNPN